MKEQLNPQFGDRTRIFFQYDVIYSPLLYDYRQIGHIEPLPGYYNHKIGFPEYCIVGVIEGLLFLTYEGKKYEIKPGFLAFFDMNNEFTLASENGKCYGFFGYFRGSNIADFYEDNLNKQGIVFPYSDKIKEIFAHASSSLENEKVDKLEISSDIYKILLEISNQKENEPHQYKEAIEYIKENYQSKIDIHLLANKCYVSYYHFIHNFKKTYLVTPLNYINNYRFKKAIQLLSQTDKSIEEISNEVGFSSKKLFVKLCQSRFGMNPSKYRKIIFKSSI